MEVGLEHKVGGKIRILTLGSVRNPMKPNRGPSTAEILPCNPSLFWSREKKGLTSLPITLQAAGAVA